MGNWWGGGLGLTCRRGELLKTIEHRHMTAETLNENWRNDGYKSCHGIYICFLPSFGLTSFICFGHSFLECRTEIKLACAEMKILSKEVIYLVFLNRDQRFDALSLQEDPDKSPTFRSLTEWHQFMIQKH